MRARYAFAAGGVNAANWIQQLSSRCARVADGGFIEPVNSPVIARWQQVSVGGEGERGRVMVELFLDVDQGLATLDE